jgi:glycosyltransferase involved in cell wall biosynthesis
MDKCFKSVAVSVVITAYNAAPWIGQTLDSVLEQTYPAAEVIVVDDGSTDRTADIVLGYGQPVRYIYQENSGQPVARNRGIRTAKGNYIAFVDADDYWQSRKLELQVELIRSGNMAWVTCGSEFVNTSGEPVLMPIPSMSEGDVLEKLIRGNFITSATPVVKRDIFESVGYFNEDPDARIGEDWDMWLRIAAVHPLGVVMEKLAYIRIHTLSMMSVTSINQKAKALENVVLRAVAREPDRLGRIKRKALADIYYNAGVQLIKQNKYQDARAYFIRELKYRPLKMETVAYLLLTVSGRRISGLMIKLKQYQSDCSHV